MKKYISKDPDILFYQSTTILFALGFTRVSYFLFEIYSKNNNIFKEIYFKNNNAHDNESDSDDETVNEEDAYETDDDTTTKECDYESADETS